MPVRGFIAAAMLYAIAGGATGPSLSAELPDSRRAEEIFAATGVRGGLVVHLGCGDGRLTAALGAGGQVLVHGLDGNPDNVRRAREQVRSRGLYGRVSVERLVGNRLPYAENLVNLLVSEELSDVSMSEVLRVLAPGGAAYVKTDGTWQKTVKARPESIDEWTHWLHGADGNAVSRDRVVGPPRRVQWVEGPRWQRHHELNSSPTGMVSAGGRIFYISDEAPATAAGLPDRWSLIARDAFNGVLLWKRPIEHWGWKAWSQIEAGGRFTLPLYVPRRLVAAGDRVYATLGYNAPLVALDAATGETVRTYDGTQRTDEVLYHEGLLVLSVNKADQGPGQIADNPPVRKEVVAVEADTGQIVWRQGDYLGISPKSDFLERITHLSLCAAGRRVFLVEEDAVVALDLDSGKELWRTPRPEKTKLRGHVPYKPENLCTLVAHEDVVLLAQPEEPYTRNTWNRGVVCTLVGMSAETGEVRWSQPCSKWGPGVKADVFVIGHLVWTHAADERAAIGTDLATGRVERKISTEAAFNETHHHRCYRNKATERYLLTARRGIELVDLDEEQCEPNHWVRGACRYGIMPANGLIYVPPHPCQCYVDVKLSGFYALATARGKERGARGEDDPAARLERGPAYAQIHHPPSKIHDSSDWPTFRHDMRRSGSTRADVPADLTCRWQSPVGGRLSPCTVAGGRVFAASIDEHRVCALDAEDGEPLWSFTTGGRVDTPPTIHDGLALFGSADGWVYGVRADDGQLVWRFRAAPVDRRIVAMGQLESAWPVHGTVLVVGGTAYVAAGRSTHLDGGIHVYALDPETGELIGKLQPDGNAPQGLEDVLTSDGRYVYMRHLRYPLAGTGPERDDDGAKPSSGGPRAYSTAGLLDPTWFSRVGWKAGEKKGQFDLAVFDPQATYTIRTKRSGGFGGWFQPGTGAYQLAAIDRTSGKARWWDKVPIRARAMAAAGQTLFLAGPPDVADPADPWAAFEGRAGGVLRAASTADGSTLAEYPLDAPPVYDGLALAAGRLVVSCQDGTVRCFAPREASAE